MRKAQGALETLVLITLALTITGIVSYTAITYFGSQSGDYQVSSCRQAASQCKMAISANPSDNCSLCDTACKAGNGSEILSGAVSCCKLGMADSIYSGSASCQAVNPGGGTPYTPVCGNNIKETEEVCDGNELGNCIYGCNSTCGCKPAPVCGNGVKEAGEACDGSQLGLCTSCITSSCQCTEASPTPPPATLYCGDGTCNNGETCTSCSTDCGSCSAPTPYCGDDTCNTGETHTTCPDDCTTLCEHETAGTSCGIVLNGQHWCDGNVLGTAGNPGTICYGKDVKTCNAAGSCVTTSTTSDYCNTACTSSAPCSGGVCTAITAINPVAALPPHATINSPVTGAYTGGPYCGALQYKKMPLDSTYCDQLDDVTGYCAIGQSCFSTTLSPQRYESGWMKAWDCNHGTCWTTPERQCVWVGWDPIDGNWNTCCGPMNFDNCYSCEAGYVSVAAPYWNKDINNVWSTVSGACCPTTSPYYNSEFGACCPTTTYISSINKCCPAGFPSYDYQSGKCY